MPKPTQPLLFQARHYVAMAKMLRQSLIDAGASGAVGMLAVTSFAKQLNGSNPNYDRDRFIAAAMGEPSTQD